MMRIGLALAVCIVGVSCGSHPVGAVSATMKPTIVRGDVDLTKKQRGFIDIVNTSSANEIISLRVAGFTQNPADAQVVFEDDKHIEQAITLDTMEVELRSHEAARLYYTIDASGIGQRDIMGAIVAQIRQPINENGTEPIVQLATLLVLKHPNLDRSAMITSVRSPFFHIGEKVSFELGVKNTSSQKNTADFTQFTAIINPWKQQVVSGPLIGAGNERTVRYESQGNYIGPVYVGATISGTGKGVWGFAITGYWRWLILLIGGILCVVAVISKKKLSEKH